MDKLNNNDVIEALYDISERLNKIADCIKEEQTTTPTELYAIKNINTGEIIFNARGGAYKDKEAALNKIKKLGSQNHCLLRYELVNEMCVSTGKKWRKI